MEEEVGKTDTVGRTGSGLEGVASKTDTVGLTGSGLQGVAGKTHCGATRVRVEGSS